MTSASTRLTRYATAILASTFLLGFAPAPSFLLPAAEAQTSTTGALSGTVTDPSGAVVPGATVTLTDKAGGTSQHTTSDAQGRFSFPLLRPSTYTVAAQASGMSASQATVPVQVGASPSITVTMAPASASQNVTVNAQAVSLTDTQSPALTTTFTQQQVQDLPAPGGDITTVAFSVPGVVVNAGGSYGNFSADGLPGTSNLYVINGFDEEDPFLNLNNSGSSNLTLGQAEIAEATVVLNGYSSQYGRQAGAIIEYTTKSGSNAFHGQANYYYNGDVLNANDWFRNYSGTPRQKAVSNEWAANIGGPIIKNKLFFFADYEGLHYVLPDSGQAVFPSAAFQAYTLGNVPADSKAFYQQAFALYNASPSAAQAVPVTTGNGALQDASGTQGCGAAFSGTPNGTGGYFGQNPDGSAGTPCETAAEGSASAENKEYLVTARVDWNVSDSQRLFGRFKLDRGTQPTYTSFISPIFNTISSQPSYEGQLNDSITLTPHLTNQFIFAANWYTAFFGPSNLNATLAAFPTNWQFATGAINTGATFGAQGSPYYFPQGRNVTQYQFVDDLSWVKGNHTLQFGYDFRREDISDYDAQSTENGLYEFFGLDDFANGMVTGTDSEYVQTFATNKTSYLADYNLGAYLQDEWQVNSRLHFTYGVRFDRNGNPLCTNNCFARYNGTFPASGISMGTPYGGSVLANQPDAFNGVESVIAQGRVGFNYSLTDDGHTVVRGGVGMFADTPAQQFLDTYLENFPQLFNATVLNGHVANASSTTSSGYFAAQSSAAAKNGFTNGLTPVQIAGELDALGVPFTPPNFTLAPNNFRNPKYIEFNMQLQHQFTSSDALIVGYVGNVGYDELIQNPFNNASSPSGFGGLPTTSPDPRFLGVNSYVNSANSNYNGVAVTYKHIDRRGLTVNVTYNYSHALDDTSNGGQGEYYNLGATLAALSPSLSALNYSNADYDIRHNVTADYLYQMPYLKQYGKIVNSVAGGWLFGGKTFWRTGTPFSVINSGLGAAVSNSTIATPQGGGSSEVLAALVPGATVPHSCTGNGLNTPCFTTADFEDSTTQTTFGNLRRNSIFGPHYADSDFSLSKKFLDTGRASLQIGAYAFNVFNHPNFANPASDVGSGNVGSSGSIVAPPTSPYGSFQSAGVGGRVLQVFGKVTF